MKVDVSPMYLPESHFLHFIKFYYHFIKTTPIANNDYYNRHLDVSTELTAAVTSHLQGDCKTTGLLRQHPKEEIRGKQGK